MKKQLVARSFIATIGIAILVSAIYGVINYKPNGQTTGVLIVQNSAGVNTQDKAEQSSNNTVKNVDKNVSDVRQSRVGKEVTTDFGYKADIKKYKLAATPNDPNSGQWWELALDSNSSVWNMPEPNKQTIIAVVDTGFALQHEEFNNRFFQNPGETGTTDQEAASDPNCTDQALGLDMSCNNVDDNVDGIVDNENGATTYENPSLFNCSDQSLALDKSCNMIDDDNNGYIDDVSGWDFVNSDPSPQAGELREANDVNTYHGTMVAGIAAASANNNVGIAGVDWNAKILPLQSLDDDGYGDSITVGNAIKYAADMGADVINLSLGTDSPDIIILQAVEYAYNKGVLVVASAGNDGCECMVWPAKYDITLSVGSSDSSGERSSFSSYGTSLDIMAPGSSITTTSYNSSNHTTAYSTGSGTSFAAPMVSGLVSILRAQHPDATPLQLAALVTEQANKAINNNQHKTTQNGYGLVSFTSSKNRALVANTFEQLYKFEPITNGGVFYGDNTVAQLYSCSNGILGTTPIYKSSKTKFYYSVNQTDLRYAKDSGYSNSSQLSACVLMPQDIVDSARSINLAAETSNTNYKSLLDF